MEAWAWLFAYVLGFGLLQLFLYRYFQRDHGHFDGATTSAGESGGAAATDAPTETEGEGIHCEHCGARNERDASYTFCRECASPLQ